MGKISKTQRRMKHKSASNFSLGLRPVVGKMGKPQKSKKHKKIKAVDPFNEAGNFTRRRDRNANRAPTSVDQEIPRKVQLFMDNQPELKKGKKKKRKRAANDFLVEKGVTRPLKPVPKFQQRKRESEEAFMRRVERETHRVILKSQLSAKYKVDFEDIDQGVEITKPRRKKAMKNTERLKQKKVHKSLKKAEMRKEKKGDFSHLDDTVAFGDVAMAPPSITAQPRKAPVSDTAVARPGKKSLLLKEIMSDNSIQNAGVVKTTRQLGQTTKRKNLSLSKQQMIDKEREKAISMYRQLKNAKLKTL